MSDPSHDQVTRLLQAAGGGDDRAREKLWSMIYDELHRLAQAQLAGDRLKRDFQPTTLVHEVFVHFFGEPSTLDHWASRQHFFGTAARVMRRIRVDEARKRRRLKRGGGTTEPLMQDPAQIPPDRADLLAVDEALTRLETVHPRAAQVVGLRFFAGLTVEETAVALDVSRRTVENDWRLARAWLYNALGEREEPEDRRQKTADGQDSESFEPRRLWRDRNSELETRNREGQGS